MARGQRKRGRGSEQLAEQAGQHSMRYSALAHAPSPPAARCVRKEFEALRQRMDDCRRDLDVEFTRIAQIQAELDQVRKAWTMPKARRTGL